MPSSDKKILVCLGFTCFQVITAFVYKFSQTNGNYTYSTLSAITIAEFIKLIISLYAGGYLSTNSISFFNMNVLSKNTCFLIQTFFLASIYCVNNQIGFILYRYIDVVTISLFKAFVSLEIAIFSRFIFRRYMNSLQWCSILLQVIGLIIVQYDVCNRKPFLEMKLYIMMISSCTLSAMSSVWNEYVLKNYTADLHLQNALLYLFGTLMNLMSFFALHNRFESYSKDFFQGYTVSAMGVILCNALLGIIITAVYKYGDAIIKTFSSALATAVLIFLNWTLFGIYQNLTVCLGAAIIFISSYIYLVASAIGVIPSAAASMTSTDGAHQTVVPIFAESNTLHSTREQHPWRKWIPSLKRFLLTMCLIVTIIIALFIRSYHRQF